MSESNCERWFGTKAISDGWFFTRLRLELNLAVLNMPAISNLISVKLLAPSRKIKQVVILIMLWKFAKHLLY